MLKALIKKQLAEIFTKMATGKGKNGRKRMSLPGFVILFSFIFLAVGVSLFFLAKFFSMTLIPLGMDWMYFVMMGLVAIVLSVFGSVFTAYTVLYNAKDNDLLLSMPIPPSKLLFARMMSVYLTGLLYCAVCWISVIICYMIDADPSALSVVFMLLMLFVLSLLVMVLTCILGWVEALIAGRVKSKSLITVMVSLAMMGLYYLLYFKMQDLLNSFAEHVDSIEKAFTGAGYPLYLFGCACTGEVIPAITVTLAVAALFALCYFIMSKTFIKLTTAKTGTKKVQYREKTVKQKSARMALLRRELVRFKNCAAYVLNAGIGLVITVAAGVLLIVKSGDIDTLITQVLPEIPGGEQMIMPLIYGVLPAVIGIVIATAAISAPSVSLEGKTLWIVRSLPVDSRCVLQAKIDMQMILCFIPSVFTTTAAAVIMHAGPLTVILMNLLVLAGVWLNAVTGLAVGIKKPILDWTNEIVPIKQSIAVLVAFFGGWLVNIIMGGLFVLLRGVLIINISAELYMLIWIIIFIGGGLLIYKWINNRGTVLFENLQA